MKTLKHLFLAALAAAFLTACHSPSNQGNPGDENGGSQSVALQHNQSINLRQGWNH